MPPHVTATSEALHERRALQKRWALPAPRGGSELVGFLFLGEPAKTGHKRMLAPVCRPDVYDQLLPVVLSAQCPVQITRALERIDGEFIIFGLATIDVAPSERGVYLNGRLGPSRLRRFGVEPLGGLPQGPA